MIFKTSTIGLVLAMATAASAKRPNQIISQVPSQKARPSGQTTLHEIFFSSFIVAPDAPDHGVIKRALCEGLVRVGDTVELSIDKLMPLAVKTRLVSYTQGASVQHPESKAALGHLAQVSGILVVEEVRQSVAVARVVEAVTEIEPDQHVKRIDTIYPAAPPPNQPRGEATKTSMVHALRRTIVAHPARQAIAGAVVDVERHALVAGYQKLIFVDRGQKDGLGEGDIVTIKPRPQSSKGSPHLSLGSGVVVGLEPHAAAVWVTQARLEISAGDLFTTQNQPSVAP